MAAYIIGPLGQCFKEEDVSKWTPESLQRAPVHRPDLVLLIDDAAGIRYVLQEVLRHHGYQVETAATIEEAEKAKQRLGAEAIGVVVLDVHLTTNPRFHEGYTLYEEWARLHPTLPVLLISGISTSQNLPAICAGKVPFLAKPFTMEALLEWVQRLIMSSVDDTIITEHELKSSNITVEYSKNLFIIIHTYGSLILRWAPLYR